MKIVVANKYHFHVGGAERYKFGISDYLASLGNEIIPFSVAYQQSLPSDYNKYFVEPAGGGGESKLYKLEGGFATKLRIATRSIYSYEARQAMERLIVDTRPDVLYCLNIVNHISPSIIDAARKHGVPVVMRMSDYYLVCPNYLYLRDGRVCTECEKGFYHGIIHKCIYGSLSASFARVAGMYMHKWTGIYHRASAFVTPSRFMMNKLMKAGFPPEKIHHIPTFVNSSIWTPRYDNDGYILFYGRLMREKGVEILLQAYIESGVDDPLLIVGDGPEEGYVKELESIAQKAGEGRVRFLGRKSGQELQEIVRGAKYVAVPSVWYDNAPNVVYESFAAGKPVVASALGGLCEQVTDDIGVLVEPYDVNGLAAAIARLSSSPEVVEQLGRAARQRVEEEHAVETHAERLLALFNSVIDNRS